MPPSEQTSGQLWCGCNKLAQIMQIAQIVQVTQIDASSIIMHVALMVILLDKWHNIKANYSHIALITGLSQAVKLVVSIAQVVRVAQPRGCCK